MTQYMIPMCLWFVVVSHATGPAAVRLRGGGCRGRTVDGGAHVATTSLRRSASQLSNASGSTTRHA